MIFVRQERRYTLQTETGAIVIAKQPHRSGAADHAPGTRILLTWAVAETLLI